MRDVTSSVDPCGDQPPIYRAVVNMKALSKPEIRELSRWLVDNCGKPNRATGFWWTDEGPGPGNMTISFALPEKFMEFSLRWL